MNYLSNPMLDVVFRKAEAGHGMAVEPVAAI
jgi:hypothetical protein